VDQRQLSELQQWRLEHLKNVWGDSDDPPETLADLEKGDRLRRMSEAEFKADQRRRFGPKLGLFARARADSRARARRRHSLFASRQRPTPSTLHTRARATLVGQRPRGRSAHTRRARAPSSSDDPSPSSEPPLGRLQRRDLTPNASGRLGVPVIENGGGGTS
jgi:hypothetical protein